MKITRTSPVSGVTRTLDLPITNDQWDAYNNGDHIQMAFPNLTPDQREFILTGILQSEWDQLFKEE